MKRYRSWIVCALLMASSAGCGVEPGVSAETSEVEQVVAITVPSLSARCTGVVIGERRVMTAAHCLVDGSRLFDPSDLRVVLARDLALVDEDQTLSVERISAHPDYVGGDEHDVAWIETHEPIGVEPVELTTSFEDLPVGFAPDTVSAMLAGYTTAQTVEPNAEAGILDIFEGELQVRDDTTFQFRAGGEAERTVCLGDSGAPVFAPSEDAGGANHLLGMVSHAVRHCTSGATVAQRVDRYRAFLLDAEISTPAVAMAQPMALSAAEATPDWPFGLRIALRSRRTGKYVSAHPDTWRPPASIADGPAVWEQFDVRQIEGAYVALRAVSSGQYLMTMADGLLTTEGTQPALWEQFVWVRHPNGSIGLQSRRTGKYVVDRVDDLAAISPQHGAWEQFDWEVVPRVSEPEHRVIPISSANPAWSALGVRRFVVSPQYPVTSGTFASLSYAVVAQGDGHVPLYFMSYEQRIDQLAAMGQTLNNPANVDVAAYFGAMFHRLKILTVSSSGEPSADDQGQLIAGLTLGVAPDFIPLARRYPKKRQRDPLPPLNHEKAPPGCENWTVQDEQALIQKDADINTGMFICAVQVGTTAAGFVGGGLPAGLAAGVLVLAAEELLSAVYAGNGCGTLPSLFCGQAEMLHRRSCCTNPDGYANDAASAANRYNSWCGWHPLADDLPDASSCSCPPQTTWRSEERMCLPRCVYDVRAVGSARYEGSGQPAQSLPVDKLIGRHWGPVTVGGLFYRTSPVPGLPPYTYGQGWLEAMFWSHGRSNRQRLESPAMTSDRVAYGPTGCAGCFPPYLGRMSSGSGTLQATRVDPLCWE